MTSLRPAAVIVLAAGEGTRMRSRIPKVLHQLAGRTLLDYAVQAANGLDPEHLCVVLRHDLDTIRQHLLTDLAPHAIVVEQDEIKGTGRAVWCALAKLDGVMAAASVRDGVPEAGPAPRLEELSGPVVITYGDVPLLDSGTLAELVQAHVTDGNAITVLTAELPDPTGYGRVVRDPASGQVSAIVEHRDATEEQRAITEFNSGIYVMDAAVLRNSLAQVQPHNAQGEIYLTDVVGIAAAAGQVVRAVRTDDPWLVEGVNDRVQLAAMGAELNRRIVTAWMEAGVTVIDPATTWIGLDVDLQPDVTIHPGTQLHGATTVAAGATLGPDTTLTDVEVGEGASVVRTHGSLSIIGPGATVGPFSYLRPGTELGSEGKIGAFVEAKNAQIGTGSKVPHLTYIGDTTVGEMSNVGAGTIVANYDGVHKHRTVIGSYVRTGAHNVFVAPVRVGDGAYTGAGSVIRRDVDPGSLGVSSGPQRNVEGWVSRRRPGTLSAEAAQEAAEAHTLVVPRQGSGEGPTTASLHDAGGDGLSPQAREELARAKRAQGADPTATSAEGTG